MFYTRIPCPAWVDHAPEYLSRATRFFPVVGWLAGLFCFLAWYPAGRLWNPEIAALLILIAGVVFTGAFHEDGFADLCDGFGGGWTPEQILDIMKDSRVGTYGVLGLGLLMTLKWLALTDLLRLCAHHPAQVLLCLVLYHSLARFTAISLIFSEPYVRADQLSKAKPVAQGFTFAEPLIATVTAALPLAAAAYWLSPLVLIVLLPLLILRQVSAIYLRQRLGGYTGDCLGALEQLAEVVILLTVVALWSFI